MRSPDDSGDPQGKARWRAVQAQGLLVAPPTTIAAPINTRFLTMYWPPQSGVTLDRIAVKPSQYRAFVHMRLASLLAALLVLASSCTATTEIGQIDPAATNANSGDSASLSANGGAELTSEAIFDQIESSMAFVLAPDGLSSGSGFMIDGGWIVTNAHVVERYESMLIGRSDGTEVGLVPVHAVDWIFDLALIGPITDESFEPIAVGQSANLSVGSRVLLAGFPDEDNRAPTPTLTEGIVSRRRLLAVGGYPFLQVDATIAPGQSGGALINGAGELVGSSGLEFGAGEFGLVLAADPMMTRIADMIVNGGPALPSGPPLFDLTGEVGPLRNFGFTIEIEDGASLDMLVSTSADVWVEVQTLGGSIVNLPSPERDAFRDWGEVATQLRLDEQVEGGEDVIASLDPGTYQVVVGTFGSSVDEVNITSVNPLREFSDDEDGQTLPVGEIVEGNFDWERDTDQWELPLTAGQSVTITADGIADTVLVVRFDDEMVATSDDAGLGLFGTGSRLEFTAETSGTYTVEVGTFDATRWGYLIEVDVN